MILIKMKPIQIIRKSQGYYNDNGEFIAGSESTITIQAHVFPIKESELQYFPEGTRLDSIYKIRSKVPLNENKPNQSADILIIAGKKYQVISMGNWSDHQNPQIVPKYFRSAAQLLENP